MNPTRLRHSIGEAWHGLVAVFVQEQNFRIQFVGAVVVLLAGRILGISRESFSLLVCAIVFVLVLEVVNSVMEQLLDLLKPRLHSQVKSIKEMMAGAVFIAALGAIVVGVTVFWPHLVEALPYFVVQ